MSTSSLPEPVRDLLAALLDALDIPAPATIGGTDAYDRVLAARVTHAKIALETVLEDDPLGIEWTTQYLRERLDATPPTGYVTSAQAAAALAAGKTWAEAIEGGERQ